MRKALIISLIVCVLAVGGIGTAFATGINFSNVGALSLGTEAVPPVNVDYLGYKLGTGSNLPVEVDGVYISFDVDILSTVNDTVIFVSLRGTGTPGTELAYCVALVPAGTTLYAATIYDFSCADGTYADPAAICNVKVTVAGNSAYVAGTQGVRGEGTGVVDMPGADIN